MHVELGLHKLYNYIPKEIHLNIIAVLLLDLKSNTDTVSWHTVQTNPENPIYKIWSLCTVNSSAYLLKQTK